MIAVMTTAPIVTHLYNTQSSGARRDGFLFTAVMVTGIHPNAQGHLAARIFIRKSLQVFSFFNFDAAPFAAV
jgi:hypothetical protein